MPGLRETKAGKEEGDLGFDLLLRQLGNELGLNFKQYKTNYLKRRIGVRMRATGCDDYLQYRQHIRRNADESQRLINDLTINVTEFFRDQDVYQGIRQKILPDILEYKKSNNIRSIRAWSAGCATGEEPYSISALILEALKKEGGQRQWSVRVTATDLDDKALDKAKEGKFEEVRLLPGMPLDDFFLRQEDLYIVREEVRRAVRFLILDLMQQPPLCNLDLILCRNVLIYFERSKQHKILNIFNRCLRNGGFLVLGKSEAMLGAGDSGFAPYLRRERVFRKEHSLDGGAARGMKRA
ncbi:MAG: protein-glutamate O-methyltransferase CheR [Actinomycetota bacterium]|nr:protein-glutamate O-methyltransferase CheR [Actinomycetota bacterium]